MNTKRLYFIDIIRAFAILMMLQGHFVDTLLAITYRDVNSMPYIVWSYFRGITAPTFFTISGLIFTYLLLKAKEKGEQNLRIKKGLIRGVFLIIVGYVIRIPISAWFTFKFSPNFLVVDVLQCIGLSLILIILLFLISAKKTFLFSTIMFFLGSLIFVSEPMYRQLSITTIPVFLSNFVSKSNGSVFTILPWFGYVCYGSFLATFFYKYFTKENFKQAAIFLFMVVGTILICYSSTILSFLSRVTNIQLFLDSANYNYLFSRLGNVFIYFAFFYAMENYLKYNLILKIGQKTLSIYVIHFIIIYGSITGYGLNLIGKNLTPWQAVFGAVGFMIVVCFISFYYVKTNTLVYTKLSKVVAKIKGN